MTKGITFWIPMVSCWWFRSTLRLPPSVCPLSCKVTALHTTVVLLSQELFWKFPLWSALFRTAISYSRVWGPLSFPHTPSSHFL